LNYRETQLAQFRKWAREHKAGVEPSGDHPGYTAEEIEQKLDEYEEERTVILPQVRQVLRERQAIDAEAKKIYPWLFDEDEQACQTRKQALQAVPALRRYPQVNLMLGDMMVGQVMRLKAQQKAAKGGAEKTDQAGAERRAPRVPGAAGAGGGAGGGGAGGKKQAGSGKGPSTARFIEAGATNDALLAEAAALVEEL
jgi:hypothetical protein